MEWEDSLIEQLPWAGEIINREGKEKVARLIADKVTDGDVIGAGSGSTVYLALFAIAEKIKREKLRIEMIPASTEISMLCVQLGIPQTTLWEKKPDWTFDGADEVGPGADLIKGRGGALFKEKLLISSSNENYILIDQSKLVEKLGLKFPVPVEVFPGAVTLVAEALKSLKASEIILRLAKGKDGPIYTENGNFILDVRFLSISSALEKEIKSIPGVIESGLFIGYHPRIIVADR